MSAEPEPTRRGRLLRDLSLPASRRGRLLGLTSWSARTIETAQGFRETVWQMNKMDMTSRHMVTTHLGSVEDACEDLPCEAVRAAYYTMLWCNETGRKYAHASLLLRQWVQELDG